MLQTRTLEIRRRGWGWGRGMGVAGRSKRGKNSCSSLCWPASCPRLVDSAWLNLLMTLVFAVPEAAGSLDLIETTRWFISLWLIDGLLTPLAWRSIFVIYFSSVALQCSSFATFIAGASVYPVGAVQVTSDFCIHHLCLFVDASQAQ